jgi:two-component system chemotaxis response regulator CheY
LARKILLADDSVTAQNMGRKILADAGYEVIAVNNGSAALKKIAELKPDLVILDVYMPGYSGLEVCQRLKESQETARIPVLLSVGKLEPFKPEEAQRVRADGFIVKPFEASELLSALSKLEDKVVPRAEPSKPGRFARAMAAAEEADRGSQIIPSNDENGWKSRIGFPKEKTEPEPKVADESPIYNPVNRDLRTIVEKPAAAKEAPRQPAAEAPEPSLDVAAMVPPSLPNDVTPEEVAAIAAAVAQMQVAAAASHEVESQLSEIEISAAQPAGTQGTEPKNTATSEPSPSPVETNLEPQAEIRDASAPPAQVETHADVFVPAAETTPATFAEQERDLPVTIGATAESVASANAGSPCWTAVSVGLDGDEAAISLEREMQNAYAAFPAAEPEPAGFATAPEAQVTPAENSSAQAEASAEVPAPISDPEPKPVPEPEPVIHAEASDSVPVAIAQSESSVPAPSFVDEAPAAFVEPTNTSGELSGNMVSQPMAAVVPTRVDAEVAPAAELAAPHQEPAPLADSVSPAAQIEITDPTEFTSQATQPAMEAEPAVAEAATAETSTVTVAPIGSDEGPLPEPKLDPETVKSTAAAWASWRQIRDSGDSRPATPQADTPSAFEVPASAPADAAAMAVAAGAEQSLQEASLAPDDKRADVASIVDSVLADLRPKLMAEISRKMAEKK